MAQRDRIVLCQIDLLLRRIEDTQFLPAGIHDLHAFNGLFRFYDSALCEPCPDLFSDIIELYPVKFVSPGGSVLFCLSCQGSIPGHVEERDLDLALISFDETLFPETVVQGDVMMDREVLIE